MLWWMLLSSAQIVDEDGNLWRLKAQALVSKVSTTLLAASIITSEMAEQRQPTEIPNLLSLRGTGGGRRRGGQTSFGHGRTQEDAETRKDRIVQQTDNDASGSRMSAVSLGYLDDPFAQAFLQGPIPRRYPIINRGVRSLSKYVTLY